MTTTTLTIDIFSDIVCPWCFIGSRRLAHVLATLERPSGEAVDARVTYRPFLLDPSTPAGGVKIADRLRAKYGRDPRGMFAQVEAAARTAGIALDFSKQEYTYPTVAAHTLLRHALLADERTGDDSRHATQRALADALFVAHFVDARNVADPDVLADLASRHGLDADTVRRLVQDETELAITAREAASAASAGIQGVPFFVFNNRLALSGAQPEAVFRDAIAQALGAPVPGAQPTF